jgi:hypothetical protein
MNHITRNRFYYNRCMHKQRGQMTIFIAFIFQILFVFFAMAINVGMMVHDKINLQNAVDLAAFYGAQRQAEVLNVVAHTNYQIRQSWKLLTWRIRAMGDATRATHPAQGNPPVQFSGNDTAWANANSALGICVTNFDWSFPTATAKENICGKGGSNINIPQIPQLQVAFFPWDFLTQNILQDLQEQFSNQCKGMGQYNRFLAVRWIGTYRLNIGMRQKLINKMAEFMKDFKDIKGESIEEGMLATFRANITRANLESLENNSGSFTTFNSMKDVDRKNWLPNIKIVPFIPYTDLYESGGCKGDVKHVTVRPQDGSSVAESAIQGFIFEPPAGADEDYHSTRGVEKNPWYITYTGAKSKTAPRKPFFPFGKAVELDARAFAQPFGGRIGPWTKKVWQRQAGHEQSGDLVDKLMPPKFTGFQAGAVGVNNLPNYSRFPNDEIGLKSSATLATSFFTKPQNQKFNVKLYDHLPDEALTDALAKPGQQGDWQRRYEIAALSPDLFDIQYYSIQPKFYESYLQKMQSIFNQQLQMPLDYGSTQQEKFSVLQQVEIAKQINVFQRAYFIVNSWEQLLTSWAPNGTVDYTFPADRFGKCPVTPDKVATDSNCVAGGRSGYSVKIVAKNFLESSELALGGDGNLKGPILNPPTDF